MANDPCRTISLREPVIRTTSTWPLPAEYYGVWGAKATN